MNNVTDEQIVELLDEIYEIGLAKPDEQIAAVRAFTDRVAEVERERCARLVDGNYGWVGENREYVDDLGEAILGRCAII